MARCRDAWHERALLAKRLTRRGLTLSAGAITLGFAQTEASARVPVSLMTSTVRAASCLSGHVAGVEAIPAKVAALVDGVLKSMLLAKLKITTAMLLLVGMLSGGVLAPVAFSGPPGGTKANPRSKEKAHARPRAENQPARTDRYGDPLPPGAVARLGTVRLRPGNAVRLVVCLADRKTFLSVASEVDSMAVCTWKLSTGELLRRFEKPTRILRAIALSPDGKTLAAAERNRGGSEFRVLLWDVATGKTAGELKEVGHVWALAFAPDGKGLATAGEDQTLRLWNPATGTELRRFRGAKEKWTRLAFASDGKVLASVNVAGDLIQLWDAATGEALRAFKVVPGWERTLAFSPDGKILAAASHDDKIVRLWDVRSGEAVREIAVKSGTSALAFSPDGKILATGNSRQEGKILTPSVIHLWDVSTGRELRQLRGNLYGVMQLTFTLDGKRLISSGGGGVMRVWDVASGVDVLPFAEHESYVNAVAYSPDGRLLATGGLDGSIRVWEPGSGKPARQLPDGHRQRVWQIAFAPDGRTLISHGHDGSVRFWDVAAGRETRKLQVPADGRSSSEFASSPDGCTVAIWRHDASALLLDAATGEERKRFTGGAGEGGLLCFSPDGRKLAALSLPRASQSARVQLWDTATGKEIHKWTVADAARITFSPDGRTLVMGGTGNFLPAGVTRRTFHAWDVATGQDHPFDVVQPARVFSVAFSPDGRMLAWGDAAGEVTLWDVAAGQVRRRMRGQHSYIESLSFSPDGKTLASASADTTVLLWDVTGRPTVALTGPPSAECLRGWWDDLASADAGKAFDAIGLLSTSAPQAVPLLKAKVRPAPAAAEPLHIARLIADLDSEEFATRQKAMAALRQLGERAEPALRDALDGKVTLETRKRIEELLESVRRSAVSGENLRDQRAVEVLEHIGTADAQKVLKALADGAAEARLTREAKASLERLTQRRSAP